MTFCYLCFVTHSEHVPSKYNYGGTSYCEDCLIFIVTAENERRVKNEKAMAYFDKHKKWPKWYKKR